MSLDPQDPRPPYQQVAAALRAAILTRKFEPGDKLPSQIELAKHYGVARMTVQQALRLLKDEGLTYSRQGSGVYARERTARPVGLRPHLEAAFEAEHVSIDFSGYTAETLHGSIAEPLDKVREGRLTPSSVRIRLLLSDMDRPLALPVAINNDPRSSSHVRSRMAGISARHAGAIAAAVDELADLGLVPETSVETRFHGSAPLFKAYIINESDVFFGYYPVVRHQVRLDGKRETIFDPMGKDAVMFQHTDDGDPDSLGSQFVSQTRDWFTSIWETIAEPR
ncbi:GntR family transcriptional regulator [Janibacter hoylei]|uniref:GntR family transcriptional regulator n=1 Tax=Janibacter hoylei TaxID=364298 RepID=UPI0027B8B76B|nr:GntR family transcriptional regulator [Janibacter hoylei]